MAFSDTMKTAIVFSGAMRSFDRCLPTQHLHVFRHFPEADFFVSTMKDAESGKADLLVQKYGATRVKVHCVEEQPDCIAELRAQGCALPGSWTPGLPYMHEPYSISVRPQAVARQLWQLAEAWRVFPELAGYDIVIRTRPDLWFHHCRFSDKDFYIRFVYGLKGAFVPWWGSFGGVNDRFAILGRDSARAYFTTYNQIKDLIASGWPLHPESLVAGALELSGAYVSKLDCAFSTIRTNGEIRAPEMSKTDLASIMLSLML